MATRNERVRLELEDHFSREMAQAAASTALLKRELNSLSGTSVKTTRDTDRMTQSVKKSGDEIEKAGRKSREGAKDIDRYSGRLRLLTEAAVLLGPALVPIGAAGVPAIAALTAGFGAAAGAAGVAILAFHGVGDALKALQTADLEPTTENLQKARAALDALGPAGAHFARYLQSLRPALSELQDTARAGLFPGLQDGIENLMPLLPQVERIIAHIARTLGSLGADAGSALASGRFSDFFDYLETDAGPILHAFAVSTGNVIEALGHLTVAFGPLTRDFTGGMERMTASFAHWADGLSQTQGFRDFVDYVHQSGPQVVALLGALGNAFVGIIRAAAPFGSAVVPALTSLLNILGAIANSPIGPPLFAAAAGMLAFNRATILANASLKALGVSASISGSSMMAARAGAAGFAIALLSMAAAGSDTAKALGDVNTAVALGNLTDAQAKLNKVNEQIAKWQDFRTTTGFKDQISDFGKVFTDFKDALYFTGSDVAGGGIEGLRNKAKLFQKQIDDATAAAQGGGGAMIEYGHSISGAGRAGALTKTQIQGLDAAMEQNRQAALASFDAVTQYASALAAARKQAKSSSAGIGASTEAGRKNREALSQLAAAWNNQGEAIRNNMGKWREARANFIQTAVAMGVPIKKARELANDLLEIPKFVTVRVNAYTDEARAAVQRILTEMAQIPRSISTSYYVNQINTVSRPKALPGNPDGSADGGFVRKTGLPYADRHHYLLADGEGVTTNRHGETDRFRDVIMGINAGLTRTQVKGMLAGGGITGARHDFNLAAGMSPRDVRSEFRAFAHDLHAAGFVLGKAFDHLRDRSVKLAGKIEDEAKARDDFKQRRSDLYSSASGAFTHDAFGGSLSDSELQLRADINDYKTARLAIRKAGGKGLDGPLAEQIAAEGNLSLLQELAGSSRGRIHRYEQMLKARGAAASAYGGAAVDVSGLQRQIDRQNRLIEKQNRVLNGLERAVENGAHKGAKAGTEGREKRRNREGANRGRT